MTSTKFSSSNVDCIAPEDVFDKPKVVQVTDPNAMRCPKCGCTSLSGNKKGYGVVKGAAGAAVMGALTGGVGAIVGLGAGNVGRKKVAVACMRCGHRWKA